jgi:PHD/YefM family antitoxin component YafN of YafNO toxin-antitoxin module
VSEPTYEHYSAAEPIRPWDSEGRLEKLAMDYAQAKADQEELVITRQYLLKAISLLPKKELKLSLTEQAELNQQPFKLEAKNDAKGTLFFRAVKSFDN